jgi:hypothetical protein
VPIKTCDGAALRDAIVGYVYPGFASPSGTRYTLGLHVSSPPGYSSLSFNLKFTILLIMPLRDHAYPVNFVRLVNLP